MQRNKTFIVVFLSGIFVPGLKAQSYSFFPSSKLPARSVSEPDQKWVGVGVSPATTSSFFSASSLLLQEPSDKTILMQIVPGDYYVQHFGFVCKKEWQFEKTTHVPLRFRLGSLDYCNTLEQKNGSTHQ